MLTKGPSSYFIISAIIAFDLLIIHSSAIVRHPDLYEAVFFHVCRSALSGLGEAVYAVIELKDIED